MTFVAICALTVAGCGYYLLLELSSGHLHPNQMAEMDRRVQNDARLADIFVQWLQSDTVLRTRDLWRLRLTCWMLARCAKREQLAECRQSFWPTIALLRNTSAPLPQDMSAAERVSALAVLNGLCRPTPARNSIFHRGLGWLAWLAHPGTSQDTRAGTRWLTRLISLSVQLWAAYRILPVVMGGTPLRGSGAFLAVLSVALVNALWWILPRLRLPAASGLVDQLVKHSTHPLAAWVLAHRCIDPGRLSTRDALAVLAADQVLKPYESRKRSEAALSAYQQQFAELPGLALAQARADALALEAQAPQVKTSGRSARL